MNLTRAFVDIIMDLGIGIDPYMILPERWEPLVTPANTVALVYVIDGDESLSEGETQFRVDLYGHDALVTLNKADELKDRLQWDRFGSSYHFCDQGMVDDIALHKTPTPIPTELDRVFCVSTVYLVTNRDR